ncbi:MAG: response regulator [Leeuwenhoekiella sp.]
MKAKRILIVEDELLLAKNLESYLQDNGYQTVAIAMNFEQAVLHLKSNIIDLILLDVRLSGEKTGIDVALESNTHYRVPFIYLTSFADQKTLELLKETRPLGYLQKPVNGVSLITTLDITFKNIPALKSRSFNLEVGKNTYIIDLEELEYVKSSHIYLEFYFTSKPKLTLRYSLKNALSSFPNDYLVRVQRGVAINPSKIASIVGKTIQLSDSKIIVSNSYLSNLSYIQSIL